MTLSLLTILLGAGLCVPQFFGIARPKEFATATRKFPRNYPLGVTLMLLATAWFVWNVNIEPIADFSKFKPHMMAGFAAVGVLSCFFVKDFLAVRALAVLVLLLAKYMVDTGRPHLGESPLVLVIQVWAYVLVVAGICFTIAPWRLRDLIEWATATESRTRSLSGVRLAFGILILSLGLTVFRGM
jgi:hypothetical protein